MLRATCGVITPIVVRGRRIRRNRNSIHRIPDSAAARADSTVE
jgi:hypothetical protein